MWIEIAFGDVFYMARGRTGGHERVTRDEGIVHDIFRGLSAEVLGVNPAWLFESVAS